jgi:hypothetical protein
MPTTGTQQTISSTLPPYTGPDVNTQIVTLKSGIYTPQFATFVNQSAAAYGFTMSVTPTRNVKALSNGGWCTPSPCSGPSGANPVPKKTLYIGQSGNCSGASGAQPPCVLDLRIYPIALNSSHEIGLHPQLVAYDFVKSNGVNVGLNPPKTVPPGADAQVQWYAGTIENRNGAVYHVPMEFGAVNLTPADPLMQHTFGLIGALIVEPKGSTWKPDQSTSTMAVVRKKDGSLFREFVAIHQDDLAALQPVGVTSSAINYRTEPLGYRFPANSNWEGNVTTLQGDLANGKVQWVLNGQALANNSTIDVVPGQTIVVSVQAGTHGLTFMDQTAAQQIFDVVATTNVPFNVGQLGPGTWGTAGFTSPTVLATLTVKSNIPSSVTSVKFECSIHKTAMEGTFHVSFSGLDKALSNQLVNSDPQTPVFSAAKGMDVRFRMLHPAGQYEHVAVLHGANWQEEPYTEHSTELGHNPTSQSTGSRDNFGANISFDILMGKAGGPDEVTGDYLYRSFVADDLAGGIWALLRVGERDKDTVTITSYQTSGTGSTISGTNTVKLATRWDDPDGGKFAKQVSIVQGTSTPVPAKVDPVTGVWTATLTAASGPVKVTSDFGGSASASAVGVFVRVPRTITKVQPASGLLDRFRAQISHAK